ncbi:MAG: ribosomal L7Ae/L30e/S12e/Gadd45 family protein [Ruminococcus sp.]|nr:ribosomal L7Ae/L30e/S12e/Gadd45 family protein [Ruminococcus sp.]CDF01040.1 ribosomal protein L7Ae/L30e/S12e/Gadd45 family [Ruminococcus sp. CAG:624]
MSLQQKIINLLTICRRAGKTVIGFDAVCGEIKNGNVFCVLTASDISAKTKKEVEFYCGKSAVPIAETPISKEAYGLYLGKQTAVTAICDKGFADKFISIINEEK